MLVILDSSIKLFYAMVRREGLFENVLLIGNVLYNISWSEQLLCIAIWNFKAKFIFHCHDYLHMVQGVETKVVDEMRINGQLPRRKCEQLVVHEVHWLPYISHYSCIYKSDNKELLYTFSASTLSYNLSTSSTRSVTNFNVSGSLSL